MKMEADNMTPNWDEIWRVQIQKRFDASSYNWDEIRLIHIGDNSPRLYGMYVGVCACVYVCVCLCSD